MTWQVCEDHTQAAAHCSRCAPLQWLVEQSADVTHADGAFGWTALHWACAAGDVGAAAALLDVWAPPSTIPAAACGGGRGALMHVWLACAGVGRVPP
jgi:hypothetical protein